jgi:hypothetical protein
MDPKVLKMVKVQRQFTKLSRNMESSFRIIATAKLQPYYGVVRYHSSLAQFHSRQWQLRRKPLLTHQGANTRIVSKREKPGSRLRYANSSLSANLLVRGTRAETGMQHSGCKLMVVPLQSSRQSLVGSGLKSISPHTVSTPHLDSQSPCSLCKVCAS